MLSLIILVIFGLGMAYFATQNTGVIHLMVGSYTLVGIPLYVVVVGSVLLGIFISWLISMVGSISALVTIHSKDAAIRDELKTIKELQKKNYELSLELARLKGSKHTSEEQVVVTQPSFFQRVRNSFA